MQVAGIKPNSQRDFGEDQEYEDAINFMRRDVENTGCDRDEALGATYSTQTPQGDGLTAVSANYVRPNQTITVRAQWDQMKVDIDNMYVRSLIRAFPLDLRSRVHVCNQAILPNTLRGVGVYTDVYLESHTDFYPAASSKPS